MPIQPTDLHFRLSVPAASSGNYMAQGNVNNSLGFYMSTTDIVSATLDNLFNDITGDENALQQVDYRCMFLYNANSGIPLQNTKVWISGLRFAASGTYPTISCPNHPFTNGEMVRMDAEYVTDTLPNGFTNSTTYYVESAAPNSFQLSATNGGGAITPSTSGTGAIRQYGITICDIALDNIGVVPANQVAIQASGIPTSTTTPTGVGAFSAPTTKSTGLNIGTIPASGCVGLWVKRQATNSVPANNDGVTIQYQGDTSA